MFEKTFLLLIFHIDDVVFRKSSRMGISAACAIAELLKKRVRVQIDLPQFYQT